MRRWAFVAALLTCVAVAVVLLAWLAVTGPSRMLGAMLGALLIALMTMAGLRRHSQRMRG